MIRSHEGRPATSREYPVKRFPDVMFLVLFLFSPPHDITGSRKAYRFLKSLGAQVSAESGTHDNESIQMIRQVEFLNNNNTNTSKILLEMRLSMHSSSQTS